MSPIRSIQKCNKTQKRRRRLVLQTCNCYDSFSFVVRWVNWNSQSELQQNDCVTSAFCPKTLWTFIVVLIAKFHVNGQSEGQNNDLVSSEVTCVRLLLLRELNLVLHFYKKSIWNLNLSLSQSLSLNFPRIVSERNWIRDGFQLNWIESFEHCRRGSAIIQMALQNVGTEFIPCE